MTVVANLISPAYVNNPQQTVVGAAVNDWLAVFALTDSSNGGQFPTVTTLGASTGTTNAWVVAQNVDDAAGFLTGRLVYTQVTGAGNIVIQGADPTGVTFGGSLSVFRMSGIASFDSSLAPLPAAGTNNFNTGNSTPGGYDATVVAIGVNYGSPANTPTITDGATDGGVGATYGGGANTTRASYRDISSGNASAAFNAGNTPNYPMMMVFQKTGGGGGGTTPPLLKGGILGNDTVLRGLF